MMFACRLVHANATTKLGIQSVAPWYKNKCLHLIICASLISNFSCTRRFFAPLIPPDKKKTLTNGLLEEVSGFMFFFKGRAKFDFGMPVAGRAGCSYCGVLCQELRCGSQRRRFGGATSLASLLIIPLD